VAASGNSESGFLPSHTDASGQFRITAPADGPVNVGAISRRFAPAVQTDILPPGGDNAPEIVLRATPGGSMRIRVTHRSGKPAAGVHPMVRPVPLYPGADLMMDRNRPQPTDAEGTSVVMRLYPGAYIVGLVGRRDATPVEAMVGEGTESVVVLEIP
jgi:hypothetical protein